MALPPIKVFITGDTTKLDSALGRAGRGLKNLATVAGVASVAVVGALAAMTAEGLKNVDANVKLARSMDATVNGLRAVQLAAGYSGVAIGEVNTSMQQLNRELARASEEGSPAAEAIQKLGMNAQRLQGLDADQRMAAIADRVKELGLNSSETADILRDLGVRSRQMTLLFLGGGDAIRSARDEVRDFGLELSEAQTAGVEAANDALSRMTLIFSGLSQRLASEVAPVLEVVGNRLSDLARSEAAQEAIERLATAFGGLAEILLSADFLDAAVSGLEGIANVAAGVAEGMVWLSQNVDVAAVAFSGLAIAVAAAGGPLTIVAGLLGGALVLISQWRGQAQNAAAAQRELNQSLDGFAELAPIAGARALSLSENNYTLASSIEAVNAANRRGMYPIRPGASLGGDAPTTDELTDYLGDTDFNLGTITTSPDGGDGDNPSTPVVPGVGGAGAVTDELQARLEALTTGLQTERETVQQWREDGLATLQESLEAGKITEEEYRAEREKLEAEHAERMNAIRQNEASSAKYSYGQMFSDLSSLMRSGNEKLFKIGQAAAIANATVSGYRAAVDAWAWGMSTGGPPLAAAATAASLARTGMMISQIASQSASGSGGGASGGGGGAGSSASGAGQQPQRVTYINLVGDTFSRESVRSTIESFQDSFDSGSRIIVQ